MRWENSSETTIGTFAVDAQAPAVKMAHRLWPNQLISATHTISGVISDQPDWAGPVLALHFEEGDGENGYYNYGGEQQLLTCSGNCPTNTAAGAFGLGLNFDDGYKRWPLDNTVISDAVNFDSGDDFTIAFWIQPDVQSNLVHETNSIIEKWGDGSSYPYSIGIYNSTSSDDGKIVASRSDGTNTVVLTATTAVSGIDFHHVALVKDGDLLTLYLDGEEQMSATDTATGDTTNSDSLTIAHRSDDADTTYRGILDELYIYNRSLTSADIYAMAQNEVDGSNQVEVAFEAIDFATYPELLDIDGRQTDVTWQPATVALPAELGSSWSYTMPDMENWYYIHVRGEDSGGNAADAETVWHGLIDHVAPTITASGAQSGSGASAQTVYTFTLSDFLLDVDTAVYPCASPVISMQTYANSDAPFDGFAYEVSGTCTADELQTSGTFSICDVAGHCVSEVVTPTVTDDMEYALAAETTAVDELNLGASTMVTYTITRSGDLSRSSSVEFDFLASLAELLSDFDNVQVGGTGISEANGTITFTTGAEIATITLDVIGDDISEPDEDIVLTLSSPTGAEGAGVGTLVNSPVTTTIVDDDAIEVKITPATLVITETGVTSADFVMTLSGEPTAPVTVTLATDDSTECLVSPNELALTPLTWNTGITATVTSVDEAIDDGDQTCTVVTSDADSEDTNYDQLVVPDVSVTVIDDDGAPSINFTTATVTTTEEAENVLLSLSLSNPSADTVQVMVTSGDDSATAGEDYTAVSETITFAPFETSATVTLPILEDLLDEPTESLMLILSAPVNGDLGLVDTATIEIEDNDAPARLSIADSSAPETDLSGNMIFTVTLDVASAFTITVDYATQDDPLAEPAEAAVAGEHYTATTGTLTFAPGETVQTIVVPIIGNTDSDPNLTFQVLLSNSNDAVIEDSTATGTIVDDDGNFIFLPMIVRN